MAKSAAPRNAFDRAGFWILDTQELAEQVLFNLPDQVVGRTMKLESGKWAVSFRKVAAHDR